MNCSFVLHNSLIFYQHCPRICDIAIFTILCIPENYCDLQQYVATVSIAQCSAVQVMNNNIVMAPPQHMTPYNGWQWYTRVFSHNCAIKFLWLINFHFASYLILNNMYHNYYYSSLINVFIVCVHVGSTPLTSLTTIE